MSESVHNRLDRVRRHVRRILWLYGLSWIVAVVFGAALLAGMLDWAVHLNDPGVRVLLGLLIVGGGGTVAYRSLIRPLATRISDVEMALRIENRFPELRDGLSSTVEFIESGFDPRVGSPRLQRTTIDRTLHEVDRVDITDVIETRSIRRIAAAAVGICLLIAVVAGLNQAAAATAFHRLVFPLSATPWPKKTELRLLDEQWKPLTAGLPADTPLRLVRGATFKFYVENQKGNLPEDVRIEYRMEGRIGDEERGNVASKPLRITTLRITTLRDGSGHSRQLAVAMLTAGKSNIWFRAIGGDDQQMPFRKLEVVPPPLIRNLRVILTPPAYMRKPPRQQPDDIGQIQGFIGTGVRITAQADKPLQSASLRVKDHPPIPIAISSDGLGLTASFTIAKAGTYSYWFDLKDREGFQNLEAPRYELHGIADRLPEIAIEKPATNQNVTADALVPLRIAAKDDLGLREIRLRYKRDGYEEASDSPFVLSTEPTSAENLPQQRIVTNDWRLPVALAQGTRLVFFAEATDDFDLGPPHVKQSLARTLTIVSVEEKRMELAARQGELLNELLRVRKSQQRTADQAGELLTQLSTAGQLQHRDVDLLKRLEIDQRQIGSRLVNPVNGIDTQAARLLTSLHNNHMNDPQMTDRLGKIRDEIHVLKTENLPLVNARLTEARKQAETRRSSRLALPSTPAKKEPFPQSSTVAIISAREQQQAVLESLDEMIRTLSQSRDLQSLLDDLNNLVAIQKKMNRDAAHLGRKTLTKSPAELTPQQRADLARVAQRQQKQADRLKRFRRQLNAMVQRLKKTDPDRAVPLTTAAEQSNHRATASRMNEAAGELRRNRIGRATTLQKQILDDLNDLNKTIRNQPEIETTEEHVQKLRKAEHDLQSLRNRQQELLQKVTPAASLSNPANRQPELAELAQLEKQQHQLRQDVARMARTLRRLQAEPSSRSARRAVSQMQKTEQSLSRHLPDQAAERQQEALDDLEQAQRELAKTRRQIETQLAREQLEQMADRLKEMITRQQHVLDETTRIDGIHRKTGRWKRSQLKSLRNLADDQHTLQTETDRLAKTIREADVFALALTEAAHNMRLAAERLAARQTDATTLALEQNAKQRLEDLVVALNPETTPPKSKQPPNTHGPSSGENSPNTTFQLAQLKMLKTLQENLLRQTQQLDAVQQKTGTLNSAQKAELNRLGGVQNKLADLTAELIRAAQLKSPKVQKSKSPKVQKLKS